VGGSGQSKIADKRLEEEPTGNWKDKETAGMNLLGKLLEVKGNN
jgi:hypothetical protein